MNVSEIRQRIFDQMDYFPDLQQYRDSVVRRMNDRYQELCDSAHWLFLQKERQITVRKQITGVSTDTATAITVDSTNTRKVTTAFTATLEMEGQTLTNTDNDTEFVIVRVEDANTLYLNAKWNGTTGSAIYNFTITFQRFALPDDCVEVLGFLDRDADRGKLLYVGRRREEFAYLDVDNTGDPSTVIEDEHIIDDPPVNKMSTTVLSYTPTSTSNVLESNTTYEYKYTIYREGRQSPPSLKVQATTLSSGHSFITLSNIDNTGYFSSTSATSRLESGMDKLVYRRDVTNDGKWMLIGVVDSTSTTFVDNNLLPYTTTFQTMYNVPTNITSTTDVVRWSDPGPRQYVRFYYTPSSDKDIHIRYHFRPSDLIADNDAPALPRQYHIILVYMTLQDMFLQMQDTIQAGLFERRAEQVKIQLRRRYLARDDERKKFERWDRRHGGRNRGVPSLISLFNSFPGSV